MLDIRLLSIGSLKDKRFAAIASEYVERLKPYVRFRMEELPALSFGASSREKVKIQEGRAISLWLKKHLANQPATVYLLAERGKSLDSLQFAKWLEKTQPLILVTGGALGFSPELYSRYPQLSLSALTFPHELARVILLEQMYRAATILNNKNYHY